MEERSSNETILGIVKKNNKNLLRTYNMPCTALLFLNFITFFAIQNNTVK